MAKLLLASGNEHKISELRSLLRETSWQVQSLRDFPAYVPPPEDGDCFLANAAIKALHAARYTGLVAMADDSGLEVDALDGAPGIYSARFAGKGHDDAANNHKLLQLLTDIPWEQRGAQFVCAVVIATPQGELFEAEGFCRGQTAFSPCGKQGFGYDPLFFLPQFGCTMAQLPAATKNLISHRADAMQKILPILKSLQK
jgi:XTP/dITP diphosphohydrolase